MEKRVMVLLLFSILLLPTVQAAFTAQLDRMEIEFNGDEGDAATKTILFEAPQFISRTWVDFIGGDGALTFYLNSVVVKTISSTSAGSGWHTVNQQTDKVILTRSGGVIEYAFFATVTNKTQVIRNELTDLGPISLYFPTTAFDSDLDDQRIRTFHSDIDNPPSNVALYVGNTPADLNDEMSFVDGGASSSTHIYGCVDADSNGECDFWDGFAEDCLAGGGDPYVSPYDARCCGGTSSNTGCGYYSDVNAWCGETAGGPAWAIPEDAGVITEFTTCPATTLVSSGTALHYCGTSVSSGATAFPTESASTYHSLGSPTQINLAVDTSPLDGATVPFYNVTVLCNDCSGLAMAKDVGVASGTFFIRQWDGSYIAGPMSTQTSFPGMTDVTVDVGDVLRFSASSGAAPTEFTYVNDAGTPVQAFSLTSLNNSIEYIFPVHGKLRFQKTKGSAAAPILPVSVAGKVHDYICEDDGVTECTGSQTPFSDTWDILGVSKSIDGATYYCTSDGDYSADLDGKNKVSCEAFGFTWTGTKCCSEADDPGETYEDPGVIGACWNKVFKGNGDFAQNQTVVSVNGTFQGCKTQNLTADTHSGKKLPTYSPVCLVLKGASPSGQIYCSNNGQWKLDPSNSYRSLNKSTAWPVNGTGASDCCSTTSCWTGSTCQVDQLSTASPLSYFGFRCEAGNWTYRPVKYNWDRASSGYCLNESQCLTDPAGSAANNNNPAAYFDVTTTHPQCLASTQYVLDHYCENGIWTTRTKLLALKLLEYADELSPTDYRLFCGTSTEALNAPDSVASLVGSASCSITGTSVPCVNNFCVLTVPGGTAWGVSLNKPVNDAKSILPAAGESASLCDGITGSGFSKCGTSNYWYDPSINSVMFVPSGSVGTLSFLELFLSFIKAPFDALGTFVITYLHSPVNDYSFFNNTHTYNKLYAARAGSDQIFAFLEENIYENSIRRDYLGAQFSGIGLGANPCLDLVLHYDSLASCNSTGTNLQIVRQRIGASSSPNPLIQAWRDLTAKLRPGG